MLIFDGYCNLCSFVVEFVLKHEKSEIIRFVAMQTKLGQDLLAMHSLGIHEISNVVYIKNKKAYI
jgi:predicted DCC family thiol-disulfide oxidoreductase YuxK